MERRDCPIGYRSYIWGDTDTIDAVAQQTGVTPEDIQAANPDINFGDIGAGALICIPAPTGAPDTEAEFIVAPADEDRVPDILQTCPPNYQTYFWATGDTPASVARRFGISEAALRAANPGKNLNRLGMGAILCIPPRGGAPAGDCPPGSTSYFWAIGDTLMGVALRHGVTMQQIREANPNINFDQIGMGAIVCIPQRRPQCTDGVLHQVRRGETISSIARAHGVTAGEIMDRNPYVDPNDLQVGMLLCVPLAPPRPAPTPVPVPPPPTPGFSCPPGYTPGTVRYGETYGDILVRYNVSYQAFRLSNPNLNLDRLVPGQRYCVPPMGSRGLCAPGANSYVIAQGENLLTVAARFNTTPGALLRLNANLAPGDFVPGRVICV